MRKHTLISWALAAAVAGALTMATKPAAAAPVPSSAALVKPIAPSDVIEVRRRGRGAGVAAGIAAGLNIGGNIASSPYG
jgi:ribosomal protein L13E